MNKQESQVIKGLAILMMIYLHADVSDFFHLTRACGPVPFFLIITGYGLCVTDKPLVSRLKSFFRLLIHYWFILTPFLIIGCYMKPDVYIGSLSELLLNYLTWNSTYNGECWFLFPYLLLVLSSQWLICMIRHYNPLLIVFFAMVVYIVTLFIYSKWGVLYIYNNQWSEHLIHFAQFMLPFSLGVIACEYKWFTFFSNILKSQILILSLLFLLIVIRCHIVTNSFDSFYSFLFISLFLSINRPQLFDTVLAYLGRHSMNMWFIHSWFCFYLFRPYIYRIDSPILIYLTIVMISLGLSIFFNYLLKKYITGII